MGGDNFFGRSVDNARARVEQNIANGDQDVTTTEETATTPDASGDKSEESAFSFGPLDRIGYIVDAVMLGGKTPIAVTYNAKPNRPSSISDSDVKDLDKKMDGSGSHVGEFLQGIHDSALGTEDPTPFETSEKLIRG